MAENQPPDQPPGPRPEPALPAVPAQPALPDGSDTPTPPRGLDAEEYRRFQEFQRFQDYQRFVAAQQQQPGTNLPVPVPPQPMHGQPDSPGVSPGLPARQELESQLIGMRQQLARIERVTNPPTWQKIVRNKWLHRAVWLVVIVVLATWGIPKLIHHYLGGDEPGQAAALHPGDIQGSGRLEQNPKDAVAAVYHLLAESPPDTACLEFTPAARTQFAKDLGKSTCLAAVRSVHAGLGDAGAAAYSFVQVPDAALTQTGGTAQISSCAMVVDSGPRLGLFLLTENSFSEWQITGHSNEPNPCPAPPATTAPPTG